MVVAAAGIYLKSNLTKDSVEYLFQAENLRTHLTFYCGSWDEPLKPEWFSLRPPGYGLYLALFSWGKASVILPLIIQVILSIASLYITWKILELITGRTLNVLLFLFPLTGFAVQFIYAGLIMSEILFQFVIVLTLACAVMFHRTDKTKWCFLFITMVTIAMLIKPVMWLFPLLLFPLAIWLVVYKGYDRRILFALIIPFTVIGAMHYRNYSLTGVAEYSSVSQKLLINYNLPALIESQTGKEQAYLVIDSLQQVVSVLPYPARSKEIDQFVKDKILQSPLQYIKIHLLGFIRFFLDTGRWELRNYFSPKEEWTGYNQSGDVGVYLKQWTLPSLLYQMYCMLMNLFLLFTFFYFVFLKSVDLRNRRIVAVLVIYLAILTGPSASARFRLPVFPLQLITCGVFFISRKKDSISIAN